MPAVCLALGGGWAAFSSHSTPAAHITMHERSVPTQPLPQDFWKRVLGCPLQVPGSSLSWKVWAAELLSVLKVCPGVPASAELQTSPHRLKFPICCGLCTGWDDSTSFFLPPCPCSAWSSRTHLMGWRRPSPPGCRGGHGPRRKAEPRPDLQGHLVLGSLQDFQPELPACLPTTETVPPPACPGCLCWERAGGCPEELEGSPAPRLPSEPAFNSKPPARGGPGRRSPPSNSHLTCRRQTQPRTQDGRFSLE